MDFFGETLDVIGKIMVAYTAIRVHFRFWKEHQIDDKVFSVMHKEQMLGIIGITLIVTGYFIKTYIHFFT